MNIMKWLTKSSLLTALFFTFSAQAGFWLQPSIHYSTDSDDVTEFEYASNHYSFILGATFGKKGNWVVGQSVVSWTRSETNVDAAAENDISMLELGPRIMYWFGSSRNFYVSGTYNFYAKGTRNIDGSEYDISGTSIIGSMGVHLKASRRAYIGFSLNYHSLSISESTVDTTKEDVSNAYSMIYPAIEISFRFR